MDSQLEYQSKEAIPYARQAYGNKGINSGNKLIIGQHLEKFCSTKYIQALSIGILGSNAVTL